MFSTLFVMYVIIAVVVFVICFVTLINFLLGVWEGDKPFHATTTFCISAIILFIVGVFVMYYLKTEYVDASRITMVSIQPEITNHMEDVENENNNK